MPAKKIKSIPIIVPRTPSGPLTMPPAVRKVVEKVERSKHGVTLTEAEAEVLVEYLKTPPAAKTSEGDNTIARVMNALRVARDNKILPETRGGVFGSRTF